MWWHLYPFCGLWPSPYQFADHFPFCNFSIVLLTFLSSDVFYCVLVVQTWNVGQFRSIVCVLFAIKSWYRACDMFTFRWIMLYPSLDAYCLNSYCLFASLLKLWTILSIVYSWSTSVLFLVYSAWLLYTLCSTSLANLVKPNAVLR